MSSRASSKIHIAFLTHSCRSGEPELEKIHEKGLKIMAETSPPTANGAAPGSTSGNANANGTTAVNGREWRPAFHSYVFPLIVGGSTGNSEVDKFKNLFKLTVKEVGQAWIMYMRFARRTEGIAASRRVFGASRKAKWLDWRVYEFAGVFFFFPFFRVLRWD